MKKRGYLIKRNKYKFFQLAMPTQTETAKPTLQKKHSSSAVSFSQCTNQGLLTIQMWNWRWLFFRQYAVEFLTPSRSRLDNFAIYWQKIVPPLLVSLGLMLKLPQTVLQTQLRSRHYRRFASRLVQFQLSAVLIFECSTDPIKFQ